MDVIDWFKGRNAFLSNFFPATLIWDKIDFPSSEHAFNAAKTLDPFQRRVISMAPTARDAKKLGRAAALRPGWDEIRVDVMADILRAKFCTPQRVQQLLGTGNAYLIEGNYWHDNFWGNCRCNRPACAVPGANNLGLLLMQLRAETRTAA